MRNSSVVVHSSAQLDELTKKNADMTGKLSNKKIRHDARMSKMKESRSEMKSSLGQRDGEIKSIVATLLKCKEAYFLLKHKYVVLAQSHDKLLAKFDFRVEAMEACRVAHHDVPSAQIERINTVDVEVVEDQTTNEAVVEENDAKDGGATDEVEADAEERTTEQIAAGDMSIALVGGPFDLCLEGDMSIALVGAPFGLCLEEDILMRVAYLVCLEGDMSIALVEIDNMHNVESNLSSTEVKEARSPTWNQVDGTPRLVNQVLVYSVGIDYIFEHTLWSLGIGRRKFLIDFSGLRLVIWQVLVHKVVIDGILPARILINLHEVRLLCLFNARLAKVLDWDGMSELAIEQSLVIYLFVQG
ncbi:unnamed protein product [Prunus brigantina]